MIAGEIFSNIPGRAYCRYATRLTYLVCIDRSFDSHFPGHQMKVIMSGAFHRVDEKQARFWPLVQDPSQAPAVVAPQ